MAFLTVIRRLLVKELQEFASSMSSFGESPVLTAASEDPADVLLDSEMVTVESRGERCRARLTLSKLLPARVVPPLKVCQNCAVVARKCASLATIVHHTPFSLHANSRWQWFVGEVRSFDA